MQTEITIGRTFVDQCIMELNAGTLTTEKASMAKYWLTDLVNKVVDECVQLHGGYGYTHEFDVERIFRDTRLAPIGGGTSEIQMNIISKRVLGLPD